MDFVLVPLVALGITQVAILATSIYLHRALAHQSFKVHWMIDAVFHVVILVTTGQRRREWVAVHRKHHTFTDKEGDPHSPMLFGFWRVQILNVYYYVREAKRPETLRFASDIREGVLDRLGGWCGPLAGIMGLVLCFGFSRGIAIGILHAVLYVFVLAPSINGLGHWRGYKNFANTAYNRWLLAWVTGGEGLHNNHHGQPRSPKFSFRRWEFDPSWPVIRALVALRLAAFRPAVVKAVG